MYHHLLTRGVITLCLAGLLVLSGLAQAGARQDDPAPRYAVTDLGAIKDYPGTVAFALNEKGVVVGQGYDPVTYLGRAAVYKDGKLRALIKGETGSSIAQDVNAAGLIVGYAIAETTSPARATLWESGKATDLGDLGGDWCIANALNDAGTVVGVSSSPAGDGGLPFVWVDGEMTALALLPQGERGTAVDVNADGLVAGESTLAPDVGSGPTARPAPQHAVVWNDGDVTDLGALGGDYSGASGINAAGQIVGYSTTAPDQAWYETGTHAVLWDGEDIVDLGTLAGGEISVAAAINVGGEIVGRSTVASGESHAFLWQDGELLDLNDLVQGGDVVLKYAYDINDKGLIVAMGYTPNGFEHAFLLTPIAD